MSARRWIQDRPRAFEIFWQVAEWTLLRLDPLFARLGYDRAARVILPFEDLGKKLIFDCQTCGQCILHSTGMTCPMTCPKGLRNGLCGGAHPESCEVEPSRPCTWYRIYERSAKLGREDRLAERLVARCRR